MLSSRFFPQKFMVFYGYKSLAMVPGEFIEAQGSEYGLCLKVIAWYTAISLCVLSKAFFQQKAHSEITPIFRKTPLAPVLQVNWTPTQTELKTLLRQRAWGLDPHQFSPCMTRQAIGLYYSQLAFSLLRLLC